VTEKRLADMTRGSARDAAAAGLLLMPLGATEQHGPHLPVSTDTLVLEVVANRAAKEIGDRIPVVLAPTLAFGSSDYHLPFGGTLSLTTQTYYSVLMDLGRSAVAGGFRRLFFLNGHGGNHELAQLAARDLASQHAIVAAAGSWFVMAQTALISVAGDRVKQVPGHAGGFETAAVLAVARSLVINPPVRGDVTADIDLLTDIRAESHGWWKAIDGFTDSPADGSAELGAQFLDAAVAKVAQDIVAFYEATASDLART
jgi:creatinine amidohydrolase